MELHHHPSLRHRSPPLSPCAVCAPGPRLFFPSSDALAAVSGHSRSHQRPPLTEFEHLRKTVDFKSFGSTGYKNFGASTTKAGGGRTQAQIPTARTGRSEISTVRSADLRSARSAGGWNKSAAENSLFKQGEAQIFLMDSATAESNHFGGKMCIEFRTADRRQQGIDSARDAANKSTSKKSGGEWSTVLHRCRFLPH